MSSRTANATAVIVPVAALEPVVAEHRRRLDTASIWGVPVHVTVLYPFVHPDAVDSRLLRRLRVALGSVRAFDCTFTRCRWFGEDVLWVAPEPDEPFRELSAAVQQAFPDHTPYGGRFDEVVPHATVGERSRGTTAELRAAETAVTQRLPIITRVDRAVLIAGCTEPDSWRTVQTFELAKRLD